MTGSATVVGRRVPLDPSVGLGRRTRDPDLLCDSNMPLPELSNSSGFLNNPLIKILALFFRIADPLHDHHVVLRPHGW